MKNTKLLIILLICCTFNSIIAQNKQISGKVVDEQGQPLIGVSVLVKSTKIGTITDINGSFVLNAPTSESVLLFRYLGYSPKEFIVGTNKDINIVLSEDSKTLEEVVVVGYGEQKRMDITGAVGSVKTSDITKAPVASFEQALAGRIAGVNVSSSEGDPGSVMNIVIRGQNSITQSNAPLYVIDGFPIEDFNANILNTNDIATIDVLKDASSTAIYGARGANGVILITTKSGKEGRPQISYDGSIGFGREIRRMELLSPYEFVKLQFDLNPITASGTSYSLSYLKPDAFGIPTMSVDDYKNIAGVDWQNQVLQVSPMQNHSLSLMGGTKATKYSMSINYLDQQGIIIKSGFNRLQGRLRLDQIVNEKLKVGVSLSYSQTKTYGTSSRFDDNSGKDPSFGLLYNVYGFRPVSGNVDMDQFLNDAIDYGSNETGTILAFNPLSYINNQTRNIYQSNILSNVYGEYSFNKYLKLRVTGGLNRNDNRNEYFYNSQSPQSLTVGGIIRGVNGSQSWLQSQTTLNENTLSYSRTFNRVHSFNGLIGFTNQKYTNQIFGGEAWHLPLEELNVYGLKQGEAQPLDTRYDENSIMSFLGRVNYNYKQRYYATASFRSDGSSKFPEMNRWGYFPSVSLSWRLSEEKFMKSLKFISDAKIRGGYGEIGNNRVGSYDYFSALALSTISGYSYGNTYQQGATTTSIGNENLKWETTKSSNIGLDLSLFNQRISITADYYKKNTTDLLLNANIAPSSGYTTARMNIGEVQNSGLELTLNTLNFSKGDFTWTSNFNISWNNNKIVALNDGDSYMLSNMQWNQNYNSTPLYIAQVGKPIAQFYGYQWDGVYQINDFNWVDNTTVTTDKLSNNDPNIPYNRRTYTLKDDVTDNGSARSIIKPGFIKYKDQNGDGHIDNKDLGVIGNPNPDFTGGFINNFTYKGFDLSIFFQFSVGNQLYNANRMLFEGTYRSDLNQFASYANRWSPETPQYTNYTPGGNGPNVYSTRTIEDGSYLRLKTLQLGYTLPKSLLKQLGISDLHLYCAAQNLFTWTKYSGIDPEVSINNSALTPGFDYSAYPRSKTISFGVNAKF